MLHLLPLRRFFMPPRILFVCTANICRSPMAEGVLRKILAGRRFPAAIESAATTDACIDMPPHPAAVSAAKRRGYNISYIVSRSVCESDFSIFDLIVALDAANRDRLRELAPVGCRTRVRLLLDFSKHWRGRDVPDPHGCGPGAFERTLDLIEEGCLGLADYLRARRVATPGYARAEMERSA